MDIGIKIAQARRELGITQIELAEKMNVTRQSVSRWESGTALPDLEKVASLAEILHVSCDYLLIDSNSNRESLTETVENNTKTENKSTPRLLTSLIGKMVEIDFYDGDADLEVAGEKCQVDGFEGNWIKLTINLKKESKSKLIPLSSILSFRIINEEEANND